MYELQHGAIDPYTRIGPFSLGMTLQEVLSVSNEFEIYSVGAIFELAGENIRLTFSTATQQLFHITVWGSFQGKLDGWLGIDDKWKVVIEKGMTYHQDDLCLYVLNQYPLMYFELGDTADPDTWNEADASVIRMGIHQANDTDLM